MEGGMKDLSDEGMAALPPDEVVSRQIVSDLQERGLIGKAEVDSLEQGLSMGSVSSEDWVRLAERGIDRDTKGGKAHEEN
jgi:hypothetical protein